MSPDAARSGVGADSAPIGLTLPPGVALSVIEHGRSELPNEACGIISGSHSALVATRYHAARNAEASPLRYNLHPEDLVRIVFEIERAGEDLLAIFHSHPRTAAVPSPMDRREAQYPRALYVIATLADPDASPATVLRAWRIHGGQSFEVPLRVGSAARIGGGQQPVASSSTTPRRSASIVRSTSQPSSASPER